MQTCVLKTLKYGICEDFVKFLKKYWICVGIVVYYGGNGIYGKSEGMCGNIRSNVRYGRNKIVWMGYKFEVS